MGNFWDVPARSRAPNETRLDIDGHVHRQRSPGPHDTGILPPGTSGFVTSPLSCPQRYHGRQLEEVSRFRKIYVNNAWIAGGKLSPRHDV